MKTEFKTKFLQHLIDKKEDKGFTLIELLVVIIIIGILSAIALPSFLNQANKAKQSEAKTYVGSMNRAQQAFYVERGTFTNEMGSLGLGVSTATENYQYAISGTAVDGDFTSVGNFGYADDKALKSYAGGVLIGLITETSESTTLAAMCEETISSEDWPEMGDISFVTTDVGCGANYTEL